MRRTLILAGVFALLLLLLAGGGAAVCKFSSLDCGINPSPQEASETQLPEGFRQEVFVSGLREPTDVAFLPGGRLLVAEKAGVVRLAGADGRLAPRPFLDLRSRVNDVLFRGLMSIQIDPDFAENGFLYVLYVRENGAAPKAPRTMRLSRFTADGSSADISTEVVLLGADGERTCADLPRGADCLPSEVDHNGGDIEFARDGTMFVSTGDGGGSNTLEATALKAQARDALGGKVLRITRDGKGLPGNPFWNGDPDANRSKVWALGLRNPFRMALQPETDTPYVGDVGWVTAEEVNAAPRGANLGWPCYEGTRPQPVYRSEPVCRRLFRREPGTVREPLVAYGRDQGAVVTLGDFFTGSSFPTRFRGALVYGDFTGSWMKVLHVNEDNRATGAPEEVIEQAGAPVMIAGGPDGRLYYLSYSQGELRRIEFASA